MASGPRSPGRTRHPPKPAFQPRTWRPPCRPGVSSPRAREDLASAATGNPKTVKFLPPASLQCRRRAQGPRVQRPLAGVITKLNPGPSGAYPFLSLQPRSPKEPLEPQARHPCPQLLLGMFFSASSLSKYLKLFLPKPGSSVTSSVRSPTPPSRNHLEACTSATSVAALRPTVVQQQYVTFPQGSANKCLLDPAILNLV